MSEIELESAESKDSSQVAVKRVSDVLFMMHPDYLGSPRIEVIYITQEGERYAPLDFTSEKDPREIAIDAGYIARKFLPRESGYVQPIIYDPKENSYNSEFKGHFIVNNGIRELHDDYLIGYELDPIIALDDDVPYKDKVSAISRKLSTCMASSQNLDLVNRFNFRFFVNDKELVNPNTLSDRNLSDEAWRNNIQTIRQEFSLVSSNNDTKQY